jgi:TET-Associated Glycosyltransferase
MSDLAIVIPSKGRPDTLREGSLQLFPDATVCVGDDEADAYQKVTPNLLVHPADVTGIGPLKQWILDHVPERTVVMIADDITRCWALVGFNKRALTDHRQLRRILEVTAQCAEDAGAPVFGFNQAPDVRKVMPQQPFRFSAWVGGVVGVIGRDVAFDTGLKLRADIDFCLSALVSHRVIWQDLRFAFVHGCFTGKGGNAVNRSQARHEMELAYLQRKWGQYLHISRKKTVICLRTKVVR